MFASLIAQEKTNEDLKPLSPWPKGLSASLITETFAYIEVVGANDLLRRLNQTFSPIEEDLPSEVIEEWREND